MYKLLHTCLSCHSQEKSNALWCLCLPRLQSTITCDHLPSSTYMRTSTKVARDNYVLTSNMPTTCICKDNKDEHAPYIYHKKNGEHKHQTW